jgi:hypothetical protein
MTGFAGEIGSGEDRCLAIGRQHHGQRPAAPAARQYVMGELVDAIKIGALLAIHLDVDIEPVHEFRRFGVLERFMGHDMAPVARRVADGQQDGLVLTHRARKRRCVPGLPMNRVVGVLQEVGAGFLSKAILIVVHVRARWIGGSVRRPRVRDTLARARAVACNPSRMRTQ